MSKFRSSPTKSKDFIAAASGEHEEQDGRRRMGRGEPLARRSPERRAEPGEFLASKEALAELFDLVARHALARVPPGGTPLPLVGEPEHVAQHVDCSVG